MSDRRTTCVDCRFWQEREAGAGECRRYAPRSVPEAIVTDRATEDVNQWSVFPITAPDDWCGEASPPTSDKGTP